jgi:hypothetical protein
VNRCLVAPLLLAAIASAWAQTTDSTAADVERLEEARLAIAAEHAAASAERTTLNASELAEVRRHYPARLRLLAPLEICARAGEVLRENDGFADQVLAEARRRSLRFDKRAATTEKVSLHATECTLWAAWGRPLESGSATVPGSSSKWHSYGDVLVEVRYGRISGIAR